VLVNVITTPRAGVSNSKGLVGRMRLKARSRGPHENNFFGFCVKNQSIWENKENNSIFTFKSSFFLMFAGRVFETPDLECV
jgi:hypothetical protein